MRALGLMPPTSFLTLDEWEIPRDRVVINRKLGEGAFGTVFGGEAFFDEKGWVSAWRDTDVGSWCSIWSMLLKQEWGTLINEVRFEGEWRVEKLPNFADVTYGLSHYALVSSQNWIIFLQC